MTKNPIKFVIPHKRVSRLVVADDIQAIYEQAEMMHRSLNEPTGIYNRFYAVAHAQVNDTDPLRFFVLNLTLDEFKDWKSVVIINPVIERHTRQEILKKEGCASFASLPPTEVVRYHKCEVTFNELSFNKQEGKDWKPVIGPRRTLNLSGKIAEVFQHEIDHLNGKYVYNLE